MTRLLTDIGGPFYDTARPFRNWSALPYYQLDLAHTPYVHVAQLAAGMTRAATYLDAVAAQGYTGIVIDNLAHLVTFDQAPAHIYAPDDPCRLRALAYGAAFERLFDAAAERGMEVFVTSDMQWATPGLQRYVGRLSADNPRLAAANAWALDELFTRFPQVTGLVVRVGETGGAHNQGEAYTGHMLYRSPHELRQLIAGLLPVCEQHNRLLVVRTWSIGIGELGDLLWSPERYRDVFAGLPTANLLASIKHAPADFFRHLPPNPTLGLPGPAQIVELQNRREYELFGMAPSSIAELHRRALGVARTSGRSAGVWAWNCTGGWGGGSAALGTGGWSLWTELSSALTAALARDPAADAESFVRSWCAGRFAAPAFAAAVAELYLASEALIEQGWYLGPLAGVRAALGGIALPSLFWVWWQRPTASPLVWAYIAAVVADHEACIAAGVAAAASLEGHAQRLADLAAPGDAEAAFVATSAAYLRDCVSVALALRALFLPAYAAAAHGDREGFAAAAAAAPAVLATLTRHRATWGERADFPALELDEVEAYLAGLGHAPRAAWGQARAASLLVRQLLHDRLDGRDLRTIGAAALALAALGAWRRIGARRAIAAALTAALTAGLLAAPLGRASLRAALPWLSRRYNLLPSIFFEAGPSLSEWTG